jgi:histidyl-tRNA synthetase
LTIIANGKQTKVMCWEVEISPVALQYLDQLMSELRERQVDHWCETQFAIVRGLAYYTGTVFEIHEATGAERAIAGGGALRQPDRKLRRSIAAGMRVRHGRCRAGQPAARQGLLPEEVYMKPLRPHAFAIAASDEVDPRMRQEIAKLRREGFHIRHS